MVTFSDSGNRVMLKPVACKDVESFVKIIDRSDFLSRPL